MTTPVRLRPARQWTREEFDEHVDKWIEETEFLSSTQAMLTNWNCLRLIAQGQRTLPWIMDRLRGEDAGPRWFCVLAAVTGIDAATGEETVSGAIQKWLEWGEDWA